MNDRNKLITYLTDSFDFYIKSTKQPPNSFDADVNEIENGGERGSRRASTLRCCFHKVSCITNIKRNGNYLLVVYVFVKILYTINSCLQFYILNCLLGNNFFWLGIDIINKIRNGEDWSQFERFPRVTICKFELRDIEVVHKYTVCIIPIHCKITKL